MQGTLGPCSEPQPWSWNVLASKRWHAWTALGHMSKESAQDMYVSLLESEAPQWWWVITAGGDEEATKIITSEAAVRALNSIFGKEDELMQVRTLVSACVQRARVVSLSVWAGQCALGVDWHATA
jgi:hypothetical protein